MKLLFTENLKEEFLEDIDKLIKENLNNSNIKTPELLTTSLASKLYGQSDGFWKKQIFERNIDFVKMGKSVKLRKKDIEKFIEDRVISSNS